ncbi:MAG: carbohydrate porin [Planctomycetaceae bacterium]
MLKSTIRNCVLAFVSLTWSQGTVAQESPVVGELEAPESNEISIAQDSLACADSCECGSDIWNRSTLTGDWFGRRSCLQQSGITFAGRSTHFAFGVNGGINVAPPPPLGLGDTFKYTGRGEYDLIFDLEKFGGMPYGTLLVRAEHWYGQYGNVTTNVGSFPPAVFPAATPVSPNDPGVPYITNFVFTQPISKELVLFAGKKDVLGAADQDEFAGGDGTSQFVNQAFVANPAFLLGLPYSSFTAGAVMPREWGMMKAFVYDPQDRTRDFFRLGDLFSQGVILGSEVSVNTNFFGKKGDHHIGGMWKHVQLTDLRFNEPPPGVYPEPTVPGFPTLSDSYTIYYGFDQYLVQYGDNPNRGCGLFGRASISDGNPTPIRHFLSAGFGGYSPVGQQRGDTFGVGWYYVGASSQFGPIPQAVFGPRNGTGVEAFYNFQITPWLNISPDVQYIRPEAGAIADDAFVYGVRVNATL